MISTISNQYNNNTSAKAWGLTALTCAILIALFVFIKWQQSTYVPPTHADDGGVEVNFGNSDQGLGNIPPMVPGDPAPEVDEQHTQTPPPTAQTQQEEPTSKEVVENNDADAPVIKTSPKPKKPEHVAEKLVERRGNKQAPPTPAPTSVHKPAAVQPSIAKPAPKPEAPKAVYKGGSGKGGNGADSYNGVSSQGVAGGRGDQGRMGGNPNSDSYTGTGKGTGGSGSGSGSSGASIISGLNGRTMFSFSFEDSFNENARVSVDVSVDADGHVTSASINPRGTTTTNSNIRSIALRRARQLKFSKGSADSQTGTVSFNFRLKG